MEWEALKKQAVAVGVNYIQMRGAERADDTREAVIELILGAIDYRHADTKSIILNTKIAEYHDALSSPDDEKEVILYEK